MLSFAVIAMLFALTPLGMPSVRALSADVVISQVYGGGGNSGAPYKNDFVELYNRGASTVTMTNWSVQYQGSTLTTWAAVTINGTINAGQYFLIQLAGGATRPAWPCQRRTSPQLPPTWAQRQARSRLSPTRPS